MWIVYDNGNVLCRQGDSGPYHVGDLPTDKNYRIFFGLQTKKRKIIGQQELETLGCDFVIFQVSSSLTDLLTVPQNQESEEYYIWVKLCDNEGYEDTLIIGGDKNPEDYTIMTVLPKGIEGV
jgi:hypothetical protein